MSPCANSIFAQRALQNLELWFGDKTIAFVTALKESKAVIAGGFALNALLGTLTTGDVDVYVNAAWLQPILTFLVKNTMYLHCHQVSPYSTSFMKRNGIVSRLSFRSKTKSIDLMILHSRTPVECASNFDLTCCQVWFDGDEVNGTHLEETKERRASITPEYLTSFLEGNRFTRARVQKYSQRGFAVSIPAIPDLRVHLGPHPDSGEKKPKFVNVYDHLVGSLLKHFIEGLGDNFPFFAMRYPDIFSKDLQKMVNVAFDYEKRLNRVCLAQNIAFCFIYWGFYFTTFLLTELEDGDEEVNVLGPADANPEVEWKNLIDLRKHITGYLSKLYTDLGIYTIFRSHMKYQLMYDAEKLHKVNVGRDTSFFTQEEIKALNRVTMWVDIREEPMTMEDAMAVARMEFIANKKKNSSLHETFRKMAESMKVGCYARQMAKTSTVKKALELE